MKNYFLKSLCNTPLPLAVWRSEWEYKYQSVHTHDCVEMQFVLAGAGWCGVNRKQYPVLAGDLYIIAPGDTHKFECNPGMSFFNIMFDETLFSAEEMVVFKSLPIFNTSLPTNKFTFPPLLRSKMSALLANLEKELEEQQQNYRLNAKALFMQFLILVERHICEYTGVVSYGEPGKVSRIFQYIEQHASEKITLEKLAALTGNSPAYLGKQFKKLTGISVTDYIRRHRIEKACCELENTSDSVEEIAARLGFYDSSYFIKTFQSIVGKTPAQYRKIGQNK